MLDIAKDALALMGEALQILGDEYAIYGFSGEARRRGVLVAKELHGAPSARRGRRGRHGAAPLHRMGPAIRHAVTKLGAVAARQAAHRRVRRLPAGQDYGPARRQQLRAARHGAPSGGGAGRIATFCVTVDPAGHDYLRTMCAEDRYLVIDDVRALPRELTKLYRGLTGARHTRNAPRPQPRSLPRADFGHPAVDGW